MSLTIVDTVFTARRPAHPFDLLAAGSAAHLPIVIGSNREENGAPPPPPTPTHAHAHPHAQGVATSDFYVAPHSSVRRLECSHVILVRLFPGFRKHPGAKKRPELAEMTAPFTYGGTAPSLDIAQVQHPCLTHDPPMTRP